MKIKHKRVARCICLALVVIMTVICASACGKQEITVGGEVLDQLLNIEESSPSQSPSSDEPVSEDEAAEDLDAITWGMNEGPIIGNISYWKKENDTAEKAQGNVKLAEKLSERFGVSILPMRLPADGDRYALGIEDWTAEKLPDVFYTYENKQALMESGYIRSIPMSLINTYAPNYASALTAAEDYQDIIRRMGMEDGEDDVYGLLGYNNWDTLSTHFSLYRLDWLEELGMSPKGNVTEVGDGLYFTDMAFDYEEFKEIMIGFVEMGKAGLAMYGPESVRAKSGLYGWNLVWSYPLMGMWGVNGTLVENNGKPMMTMESEGYKEYLQLIQQLANDNAIKILTDYSDPFLEGRVGWKSDNISLFGAGFYDNVKRSLGGGKILIAPPEIGPNGRSGTPTGSSSAFFDQVMCVGKDVSDEELIIILRIFDALSYEPELWLEAQYGIEDEDWSWEGEPYDSRVVIKKYFPRYYRTNVSDRYVGDFTLPTGLGTAVAKYVFEKGESLALYPYYGTGDWKTIYTDKQEEISRLGEVQALFLAEVAAGEKNVVADWDEYIAELNENGLEEITESFGGENN